MRRGNDERGSMEKSYKGCATDLPPGKEAAGHFFGGRAGDGGDFCRKTKSEFGSRIQNSEFVEGTSSILTISGVLPVRTGGPQVPTPLET